MLFNSDGLTLPVIFIVYQKVFKCHCWYILPVFTNFQNKNVNRKNIQYENNVRIFFTEKKKTRFVFQKAFFQKVHLEKGESSSDQGRLVFGSLL